MVDFSEFLSKPVGDIKEVLLPIGHYVMQVTKHEPKESAGANGKAKRAMYAVTFAVQSAYDDVDAAALPADGLNGIKRTTNFIIDAEFGLVQLRKMMEAAGIEMDPAESIGTYLPQLDNATLKVFVTHRLRDKDNPEGGMTEDLNKFLPVQ
jgi:hypothetical protein